MSDQYFLLFSLQGIRQLKLPELGDMWLQFCELEIHPIRTAGLEDINYFIEDHHDGLSCYCKDVIFLKLQKLADHGRKVTLWETRDEI